MDERDNLPLKDKALQDERADPPLKHMLRMHPVGVALGAVAGLLIGALCGLAAGPLGSLFGAVVGAGIGVFAAGGFNTAAGERRR
jgi:uncharacterized membrane protein